MKRCVLAIAAVAAAVFSNPAFAADMALKAPPAAAPACAWCGWYIGGEVGGYGAQQTATTDPYPSPGFGAPAVGGAGIAGFGNLPTDHSLNSSGGLGGGYIGYNWQVSPSFILGVEADVDWLHRSVSDTETVLETFSATPGPAFNMMFSASNDWIASARARAGWIAMPNVLLYVTGGAAWTNTNYAATASGITAGPVTLAGVSTSTSWSDTRTGYAIGAGGEWMLTPNWILRLEYVHYGFDGSSAVLPLVVTTGVAGATCVAGACNWALQANRLDIDSGVVGISYKFGDPLGR